MVKINLLPWREQLREEKKRAFFSFLGLAVSVVCFLMLIIHVGIAAKIFSQEERNKLLKVEIKKLDAQIKEIELLEKEKESFLARMQIIQALQGNRPLTVKLFDNLVQAVPNGIYLDFASRKEDKILITGFAESNSEVSQLMRNISSSPWINNPKLTEVKKRDSKDISVAVTDSKHNKQFQLEFSIRKADLSEEEQLNAENKKKIDNKKNKTEKPKKPVKP